MAQRELARMQKAVKQQIQLEQARRQQAQLQKQIQEPQLQLAQEREEEPAFIGMSLSSFNSSENNHSDVSSPNKGIWDMIMEELRGVTHEV